MAKQLYSQFVTLCSSGYISSVLADTYNPSMGTASKLHIRAHRSTSMLCFPCLLNIIHSLKLLQALVGF